MENNFLKTYMTIFILMIFLRLYEMYVSKKNENYLREFYQVKLVSRGEHIIVYLFHVTWFLCLLIESFKVHQLQEGFLAIACYLILFLAQVLRFESMQALGVFWTAKIFQLNKEHVHHQGIYRYIAHPSYLAVVLEFIALPLIFNAYFTLFIFSIINLVIIINRINMESKITGRYL